MSVPMTKSDAPLSQESPASSLYNLQQAEKLNNSVRDPSDYQNQIFRELDLMRQPLDFDDDFEFELNYENIPEYNVREKLQSINEQLASESLPSEEHRVSKVAFRDEIVSLVAPPAEYYQSDSEQEDANVDSYNPVSTSKNFQEVNVTTDTDPIYNQTESASDNNDMNKGQVPLFIKNEEPEEIPKLIRNEEYLAVPPEKEDLVVSRGGKFQLLDSKEITDESSKPITIKKYGDNKQSKKRPTSAQITKMHKKENTLNIDCGSSTQSDSNSRSNSQLQKQGVPRIDKDALRRQKERKQREEEELKRQEEEKQNMKKEMNEKTFNAWLQIKQKQKKEDADRKKKEEDEENERKEKEYEEKKILAHEKEAELLKKLEQEKKKEEKLKQYRLKEIENATTVHSDSECRKAFKEWLKKKHEDHKNKIKEEKQNARITRLAMRQCRKSQNLAQAIQQSSSFHYLDFYDYP